MYINGRFQSKHIISSDNVWDLIQRIEKDICFLYHQLSSYSYIMGDLCFNEYYNLAYWEYINVEFPLNKDELGFIKEGCLILILTMAWEQIDGAGYYINDKIEKIMNALEIFEPLNEKQSKLHDIVTLAVTYAKNPNTEKYNEINNKSDWVHQEFVRRYFRNIVKDFDFNPYFKKE